MLELISRLIPPPLLLGLLIWGLICAIWLQPAVEKRQAAQYVAQCEAGDLPKLPSPKTVSDEAPSSSDPLPETPVAVPLSVQIVSELRGMLREERSAVPLPYQAGGSECEIAVDAALTRLFWQNLFHVMSLRQYTPRPLQHVDQYVAREMAAVSPNN